MTDLPFVFTIMRKDANGNDYAHECACFDYALLVAAGLPITARTEYAPKDEAVEVITDISTLEVTSTWSDDHILCCKVMINRDMSTEREHEVWWCGWEGVAAFSYYNDAASARDHVHGYGLLVSDDFEEYHDTEDEGNNGS